MFLDLTAQLASNKVWVNIWLEQRANGDNIENTTHSSRRQFSDVSRLSFIYIDYKAQHIARMYRR